MPDHLLKGIDVLPRHAHDFLWADYVELLCLCSANGCVSSGNVHALTQEAQDVQSDQDEAAGDDPGDAESPAELDDRIAARWTDIRRRLQARSAAWPGWPFELEGQVLTRRFDAANAEHRLYVALLVASSLRLCASTRSGEVTSAFEEISYHWLRRSLNDQWEVRPFGAHQTLPGAYAGSLRAKLEALAMDIKAVLMKPAQEYDPCNSGDGGIDLVAWMRMGDQRGNWPVIFGQCACSPTDWESKQYSVTPSAVRSHLAIPSEGMAYCFVPHDLHASNTGWQRASNVGGVVLVDRARILHLFKVTAAWADLPVWAFVNEPCALQAGLAA